MTELTLDGMRELSLGEINDVSGAMSTAEEIGIFAAGVAIGVALVGVGVGAAAVIVAAAAL